jgi:uncharacterized protein (DUF1015 family)
MADVQPLRGIRFAQGVVGDLAQVITPPYDVISEAAQARYYAQSLYNIIRLELGQEYPQDTALDNRYTRAAATFAEWRYQGVLRQEEHPSFYLYQQIFRNRGRVYTRTSLLARVRLEAWSSGVVLPHEHTLARPKDDRLNLLRACAANFSPIMSMYDDPQGRLRRLFANYVSGRALRITDEVGEEHRLQPITDAEQISLIQDFFAQRPLYIADGHHRYETALNYREQIREQRRKLHDDDAVSFVLMALVDLDDPGLVVLPTHRLLFGLSEQALQNLSSQKLGQYFSLQDLDPQASSDELLRQLAAAAGSSSILSTPQRNRLLSLNGQGRERMERSGHAAAWNELDVAVVHTLILEDLLGISPAEAAAGAHLRYTRDAEQALEAVQSEEAQAALLLEPTLVRQICDVAAADERMPQKSTYFYPKLITGMVINPLW